MCIRCPRQKAQETKGGTLQVSAEVLEQSGGAIRSTGTYIGCMFVDYMSLQREAYGMSSTGAVSVCLD